MPSPVGRMRFAAALRLAWLLAAAAPLPAWAAFQDTFNTPESTALGGVSLARPSDSAALFLNPAGIEGLKSPEGYFDYTNLVTGLSGVGTLDTGFMAAAVPTSVGSFGFGIGLLNATGLLQERTIAVGYATTLWDGIRVGIAGKNLYEGYDTAGDPLAAQDPVFANGASKSVFAVDAGVIAPLTSYLSASLALRDINEPDIGLASPDIVQRQTEAGLALSVGGWRIVGDLLFPGDSLSWGSAIPALGVEIPVNDRVVFRVGVDPTQVTGGIGLRFGCLTLDYAMAMYFQLPEDNYGTQTLGLRYSFGGAR